MKVHVIKYVGRFGGAEAKGIAFPKGQPVIVSDGKLAATLCEQPDFVESSLAELEQASAPAPTPAPVKPVTQAPKENA